MARFYGPLAQATSSAALITVPTGHRYTIRSIVIHNETATACSFYLAIGAFSVNTIIASWSVEPYETIQWDTIITLEAAEVFRGYADVTNSITLTISGWDEEL